MSRSADRLQDARWSIRQSVAAKKQTQVEKLHAVLSDLDWHGTDELIRKVGHRFGASISELRHKHALKIVSELDPESPKGERRFRYRLVATVYTNDGRLL